MESRFHTARRILGKTLAIVGGLQLGLLVAHPAAAQSSGRTLGERAVEREVERAERLPARRPFLTSRLSSTFNSLDRSGVSSSSLSSSDSLQAYAYGDPGFLAAPVYAVTPEGSSRRVGGPTATPASIRSQLSDRQMSAVIPRPAATEELDEPHLGSRRTRAARGSLGRVANGEWEATGQRERLSRELPGILDEPVDGEEESLTPPSQNPRPIGPRAASRNLPRSTGR